MDFTPFEPGDVEQSIPSRFAQQVVRVPDRLAVRSGDVAWTYAQLNARSDRLARAILARRQGQPAPIALLIDDSAWLIAATLAVLASGNLYVVLDPREPHARTRAILLDSRAELLICNARTRVLADALAERAVRWLVLEDVNADDDAFARAEHPAMTVGPEALANIVYTSGSTGHPKGVLQTHRNLLHCVRTTHNRLHHTEADRMALLSPPTVGVSSAMLLSGLLIGAAVFPFDVRRQGVASLAEWLDREQITASYSLPSVVRNMFRVLPPGRKLQALRTVKLGGEPVYRSDLPLFREHLVPGALVQVTLGTTETYAITWWHPNIWDDSPSPVLPVGKAEEDARVFLLDDNGQAAGPGEIGEIMLQSRYLSPGYWQQPELTAATYAAANDGERIYRSGDLGRWLPDGNLEHLGRKDFAVKLSGHLVSPTEIETVMREVSSLADVAVVGQGEPGGQKRLVAYVVPAEHQELDVGELRQHLSNALPAYMVPATYVRLDRLPRLPNGKLDVRALARPGEAERVRVRPVVAPRTPIEELLAGIWREVLGTPEVGATDGFSELGGDSLQAAQVLARASVACGIDLPFEVLIEARTLEMLAAAITERIAASLDPDELADLLEEVDAMTAEIPRH